MSLCCHGNLCFERVIENVIKYDLYLTFPRIFAHNVQIHAKLCCKNFSDVCRVFRILHHYPWGAFYCGHAVDDGTEMVYVTPLRGEFWHLVHNLSALVAISKGMQAAEVCSNKILQFLTWEGGCQLTR